MFVLKCVVSYQVSNVGFDLCQEHDIMCDENGEISSEEMAELRFLTKKLVCYFVVLS